MDRKPKTKEYQQLSRTFMATFIAIHQAFFRKAALPLPVSQFSALMTLSDAGTLSARELSDALSISQQQLTPIIGKLERLGLLSRHARPDDRRFIELRLTDSGQAVTDKFHEHLRQRIERGLHSLPSDEFDRLAEHINALHVTMTLLAEISSPPA